MNVLIISGFLGAGKTTFIQRLIEKVPDRQFAIFENEFGETDMDAKVLENASEDLRIWEMRENCVCCTGKADFLTNLLTISSAVEPEVLIVEPTGVARLGNLIRNIEMLHYDKIRMLYPLTIVDARAFFLQKEDFDEIYWDQISHSPTVLLSKSEDMSESELTPIKEEIRKHNPSAVFVSGDYSQREPDWWNRFLDARIPREGELLSEKHGTQEMHGEPHSHEHHPHEEEVTSFTLSGVSLPTPVHLMTLLDLTAGGVFGNIPRAKGFLPAGTPGEFLRFDYVSGRWMISGFPPQEETKVTFIGKNIREEEIKKYFRLVSLSDEA